MEEQEKSKSPFKKGGMFDQAHPLIFARAKDLRRNLTGAEKLLWNYLKTGINGLKFRRQHPIGLYIADFYCHPVRLIVEVDGKIHDKEEVSVSDEQRETDLRSWGNRIVRFKNEEVFNDVQIVLLTIKEKVEELQKAY